MITESIKLADEIASKSPVAVQATKNNLVYSLEHTNQEGLDHIVSISMDQSDEYHHKIGRQFSILTIFFISACIKSSKFAK